MDSGLIGGSSDKKPRKLSIRVLLVWEVLFTTFTVTPSDTHILKSLKWLLAFAIFLREKVLPHPKHLSLTPPFDVPQRIEFAPQNLHFGRLFF